MLNAQNTNLPLSKAEKIERRLIFESIDQEHVGQKVMAIQWTAYL